MKHYLSFTFLLVLLLSSCIKDELQNTECDIESAWIEGEQYAEYFYESNQMRIENISTGEKEFVFTVRSLISLPTKLPVNFKITSGATIEPANGSEQDFTKGPVTYTVTSEDGEWKRIYSVAFKEAALPTFTFSFENYETIDASNKNHYHNFYELDQNGTRQNIWASGNPGAIMVKYASNAEDQPTYSTPDGYKGRGVCLNTQSAGDLGFAFKKPIAAGNLFLGKFISENIFTSTLKTTQFGIPMDREPIRVTGYYKYTPGTVFTDMNMKEVPGRTDEASIYAVFYLNKDAEGNDVYLYGDDVFTNPNILSIAQVESLPPTNEWTRFEMFFKGKEADEEILKEKGYNLALVFSSSKEGASFEGAIGSVLYIDEVNVSFDYED